MINTSFRKANLSDVDNILDLINNYSSDGTILYRDKAEIIASIDTFFVALINNQITGIISYFDYGQGLYEIRSLAVNKQNYGSGLGRKLVESILSIINDNNYKKIFVLTYIPDFFKKFGFTIVSKDTLPEKIWKDCSKCTHQNKCDEIALIKINTI